MKHIKDEKINLYFPAINALSEVFTVEKIWTCTEYFLSRYISGLELFCKLMDGLKCFI